MMKKRKKGLLMLLCMVLIFSSSLTVSAGSQIQVLDKTSFEKELDSAQWHNANGDVYVENGRIVFPKESTADTKLVWKSAARDSGVYEELLTADTSLQIKTLPEGQNFILAFGMKTVETSSGSAGNVEIIFQNKGGIQVTVVAYNDSEEAVEVVKETAVGARLNSNIKISLEVTTKGEFDLSINGKNLCKKTQLPVDGSGRIGFLQTGSCEAIVSDLQFKTYEYETPENCDINEDFNDGTYNANLLNVRMTKATSYPAGAVIEDYNGEKALVFTNTNIGFISTKYTYSNFELEFDVLYQKNLNDLNENGAITKKKTDNFLIRYGCDESTFSNVAWGWSGYSGQIVVGNGSTITHTNNKEIGSKKSENHLFSAGENEGKGYSLKFTMIDNVLTAYVKWIDEKEYTQVMVSDVGVLTTPKGFIQIIMQDGANIVFDNLKITNKDINPALVDVEFKTNVYREVPDYDYTQQEVVYMEPEEEQGFNWYIIPLITLVDAVIVVGITVMVVSLKTRKRKKATEKVGELYEKK